MRGRNLSLRARGLSLAAALIWSACGGEPGGDGSQIPVPYDQLHGGIVFATAAIPGSSAYDLFFIQFPDARNSTLESPFIQLTSTAGNEWQPSVAFNGGAIAFVRDFEIFVITSSGRIRQVSDTSGGDFKDSLPAVSRDAEYIAWVREDFGRKIGNGGFVETYIMMANIDGTNPVILEGRDGFIQDAPAFDPARGATRVAWTEFRADTLDPNLGPQDYGVRVFDFSARTGTLVCQSQAGRTPGTQVLQDREFGYRCMGQHLSWPVPDTLMMGQDMLKIRLTQGNALETIWPEVVSAVQRQVQAGSPDIGARPDGFHPAFPISMSFSKDTGQLVFDGLIEEVDGNLPTLAMYATDFTGIAPFRIRVAAVRNDIDSTNTIGHLFSVATPQVIPFPGE